MIPQTGMTSEARMSPQAGIVILQADVISQADIILQADTRTRLTRPCFCICFSMNSQAEMISEANMTPRAYMFSGFSTYLLSPTCILHRRGAMQ